MPQKPTSVSDLLGKPGGVLERLRNGAGEADRVLSAVRQALPGELRERVWGASVREGTLTLLVTSASWATRIRYRAPALRQVLGADLGVDLERVAVRVRPVGTGARR